jgi:hypothetical protein
MSNSTDGSNHIDIEKMKAELATASQEDFEDNGDKGKHQCEVTEDLKSHGKKYQKQRRRPKEQMEGLHEEHRKEYYVHKYSRNISLSEALIVAGQPFFLQLTNDTENGYILTDRIKLSNMIIKPKDIQSYSSEPYFFRSDSETNYYLNLARKITNFDQIFKLVKIIFQKYVDADLHYIILLAADTIYRYFQDRFGTTHYLICIGDNSSGKNSILITFANLGYRVLLATSVSAANVYTFLGTLEECQGTIAEDEINNLDNDPEKLNVYKSGYSRGSGKIPKIDLQSGRVQEVYLTYCFKIFASERSLDNSKAKGLLDRSFVIRCIAGRPQYNIKEVFDKTNEEKHVKLKNELEKTRKLLLIYRMLHYNDTIKDVDLNIYNREAELTKPLIRLFQNSPQVLEELLAALSKCLNSKREIKSNSLEAILYIAIRNLIPYECHIIDHESIINEVKRISNGEDIPNQQAFYTDEMGKVSNRKIIGTLIDKFKARRTSKGTGDNKMRALEFLEEDLKRKDKEFNVPDVIEIMEPANVDQGFNKSDSFDSMFASNSGTEGTEGTEGTQLKSGDVIYNNRYISRYKHKK